MITTDYVSGFRSAISSAVTEVTAQTTPLGGAYLQGYLDAKAKILAAVDAVPVPVPSLPQWAPDVIYTPDYTIYIAPGGSDTNDGSQAHPLATFNAACNLLAKILNSPTPPKLPAIAFRADGTYTVSKWLSKAPLLVTRYGQTNVEQRPEIRTADVAFAALSLSSLHFQHLRIVADPTASVRGQYGLYFNGCSNVSVDYCEVEGFSTQGVAFIGGSGFRFWHNYVARTYPTTALATSGSGLYTEGVVGPDVQANVFYHCGWDERSFDLNKKEDVTGLMFRHGWYESMANGSASGVDRFNIYIDNACTGHQGRNGGLTEYCVFQSNGNASDSFVGCGENNDSGGEFSNCVVFGNTYNTFAFWGGGLYGFSKTLKIHDIWGFSASTMGPNPLILIDSGNTHMSPTGCTAVVSNIHGIWPIAPAVKVSADRQATTTVTNVEVRQPKANEHVPSLNDYCSTDNDEATAQLLRTNLHNSTYGAPSILAWAMTLPI